MPMTHFTCPDAVTIQVQKCLERCRMQQRCLTRTTLTVIASGSHEWDGTPHVTALLNGTMMEFLKITRDYAIKPKDRAFALLGSSHHKLLEATMYAKDPSMMLECNGFVSELALNNGWLQGTLDLLERDGDELVLVDYKTWGSMRLVRDKPIGVDFDPKSGQVDLAEVGLQMNMYRVMAEQTYNWHITRMQVQCTVRDGGLAIATKRGVRENIYLIPVSILPDALVLAYFTPKAALLQKALENRVQLPEPCSDTERWNGNRCKSYCEVAVYCPVGISYL